MIRPPASRCRRAALLLASLAGLSSSAEEARLSIGPRVAVVQESVRIRLPAGGHPLRLEQLPTEADPATLRLQFRNPEVELTDWRTDAARAPEILRHGRDAMWVVPATREAAPVPARSTEFTVSSPRAGVFDAELAYSLTGLVWEAYYNVVVRGDLAQAGDRIAVDIAARVRIDNRTHRAWPAARVLLVSGDASGPDPQGGASGFLLLDEDDPLTAIWRRAPAEPTVSFSYALPGSLDLPAANTLEIEWHRMARRPAERIYRLEPGVAVTAADAEPQPFDRWLEVESARTDEPVALPAGAASIFLVSQRAAPEHRAWFPHTPPGGRLRMNLGPESAVTGVRRNLGRSSGQPGHYDETFSIAVVNRLASPVRIEVLERPTTDLEWDVVNSTAAHTRAGRTLLLTARIDARSTRQLRYTLRVREPVI